jgi:hypothetical protein
MGLTVDRHYVLHYTQTMGINPALIRHQYWMRHPCPCQLDQISIDSQYQIAVYEMTVDDCITAKGFEETNTSQRFLAFGVCQTVTTNVLNVMLKYLGIQEFLVQHSRVVRNLHIFSLNTTFWINAVYCCLQEEPMQFKFLVLLSLVDGPLKQ